MSKTNLMEMTWQEAEQAFAEKKVAVIPVGSNEQHGPALPVSTDWVIADYLAKEVAKKTDKAIVTPVIPFGHALYHADFPGTLAVSTAILGDYVRSVCEQLVNYGITHILFINGHGGNNTALYDVGQYFRLKNIPVANIQWFDIGGELNTEWGLLGHGDIIETSMMLHINPDIVRLDRANIPVNKKIGSIQLLDLHRGKFEGASVYMNVRTKDVSDTGDLIEYGHSADADYAKNPKDATAELGKAVAEGVTDYIARFIDEFAKVSYK